MALVFPQSYLETVPCLDFDKRTKRNIRRFKSFVCQTIKIIVITPQDIGIFKWQNEILYTFLKKVKAKSVFNFFGRKTSITPLILNCGIELFLPRVGFFFALTYMKLVYLTFLSAAILLKWCTSVLFFFNRHFPAVYW